MRLPSISSLDLFAIPFEYSMDNNKRKKHTILGGVISLAVISISFSYLGYLFYLYFTTQLQPTTSSLSVYYDKEFTMSLWSDLVGFQLYVSGTPIDQVEKMQRKTFMNYIIQHTITNTDGTQSVVNYNTIPCKDEEMAGFLCIDFSKGGTQQNSLSFTYRPNDTQKETFKILLSYCNNQEFNNCATFQETQALIIAADTTVVMKFKMYQYNPFTKKPESRFKTESINVSTDIVTSSSIFFIKSTASVSNGMMVQSDTEYSYLSDYQRQDQIDTFTRLYQNDSLALFSQINFLITDNGISYKCQYPLITTVLAQFTSLFNMLLVVGFLSKSFAQNEIIQDFIEVYLKVYYQKTAIHLMQMQEKKNHQEERKNQQLEKNNQQAQTIHKTNLSSSSFNFKELYSKITNTSFRKTVDKYMKVSFFKKLQQTYFSKIFTSKDTEMDQEKSKLYSELMKQTKKSMNIIELQKEILTLKMMIRMIVSVEQFAAMQLCGVELQIDDQRMKNKQNEKLDMEKEALFKSIDVDEQQKGIFKKTTTILNFPRKQSETKLIFELEQKIQGRSSPSQSEKESTDLQMKDLEMSNSKTQQQELEKSPQKEQLLSQQINSSDLQFNNHLEKIDLVEKDESYFEECLQNFLTSSSFRQSEIDQRIMDCMVGFNERNQFKKQFLESSNQATLVTQKQQKIPIQFSKQNLITQS